MLHTLNIKNHISHICLYIYIHIYILYIYVQVQPSNIPNFHISVVDFATNLAKGGRGSGALSDQGQRGALSWVAPGANSKETLGPQEYRVYIYMYVCIRTLDIYIEYHVCIYVYIHNRHICIYIYNTISLLYLTLYDNIKGMRHR